MVPPSDREARIRAQCQTRRNSPFPFLPPPWGNAAAASRLNANQLW